MTNDNKDPQITPERVRQWLDKYGKYTDIACDYRLDDRTLISAVGIAQAYLQQAEELKQLRAERQWQDISTAPKDGTKILAYLIDNAEHRKSFPENERNGIDIIVWTNHNKGGWISNRFGTPTLWVPLLDKLTDSAQRVTNKEGE